MGGLISFSCDEVKGWKGIGSLQGGLEIWHVAWGIGRGEGALGRKRRRIRKALGEVMENERGEIKGHPRRAEEERREERNE